MMSENKLNVITQPLIEKSDKFDTEADLEKGQPQDEKPEGVEIQSTFTCGICYIDYDAANPEHKDFEVKMLEGCEHMFCGECFTEYYRSLIEE